MSLILLMGSRLFNSQYKQIVMTHYRQTSPRTVFDEEAQCEWVYRCGWSIKGAHPYRPRVDFCNLSQPIGILCFYKETGILPLN